MEACPELGTPATPARPRIIGRPSAAFRLVNGVGIATSRVFGAESSRPASLLCTLRTHQSPGEWQHSLPACLLDSGRAGLTPAGFHQEVSPFHLRFLLFQAFPSAMTMSAVSNSILSTLPHALGEARHFALVEELPIQPRLARNRFRSGTQSDPCISSVCNCDHDYYFELLGEEERDTQSISRCSTAHHRDVRAVPRANRTCSTADSPIPGASSSTDESPAGDGTICWS